MRRRKSCKSSYLVGGWARWWVGGRQATLKERSEFLEDCMSDKARMLNDIADIQRSVQPQKDKVRGLVLSRLAAVSVDVGRLT